MAQKIGVMVCGHGSRSQPAVDEFAVVAERLRDVFPDWPVEYGYLEFANPVIRDGLDRLREAGCDQILAVPGMLFAAMHAKNDIPSVLNTYAARHGIRIGYGRDLGVDPKMLAAAGDRVRAALEAADAAHGPVPLHDTVLVVIGRGASDPDANANVAKVTRLLWEGFGFGWAETGYSGVTFPLVEPCLERVVRLGFRRVVVFPYFLFTGMLVDRIYGFTDWVAERHPDVQFVKAGYLNDHPQVVATFAERVREILDGANAMNCQMCKYRAQVLGFEAEVGSPQESHHHHVEGQGATAPGSNVADCALCDTFCTGACRLLATAGHQHGHDHARGHQENGAGHHHGHGLAGTVPAHAHDEGPAQDGLHRHHHHPHDHGHDDARPHDQGDAHGHQHPHDHPHPHDHGHGHSHQDAHAHPRAHDHAQAHDHGHEQDHHAHVHPQPHDGTQPREQAHHGHPHAHPHGGHAHDHHHPTYPHADHPLGPESVRRHLKTRG